MSKKCSLCGSKIGFLDQDLKFQDGIICGKEIAKYKFSKKDGSDSPTMNAIGWAGKHSINDLKRLIQNGQTFKDVDTSTPKFCFNCGRKFKFSNPAIELKDGALCSDCFEKYGFSRHASSMKMQNYLKTLTVDQCRNLLSDPEKINQAKINYGYKKHFFEDESEAREKEKESLIKHKATDERQARIEAKNQAAKQKYEKMLPIFQKEASAQFSSYIFDDKRRQILRKKSLLHDPEYINYSDILSYQVNQQGHNETKKHGITRAVVGGMLAGGVGAVVGATTGGKQTDYIDHLGLIINLKDGKNFEIVFIRKLEKAKANSFTTKQDFDQLNQLISIVKAIINNNQSQSKQNIKSSVIQTDPADEIRKFKKLADDGIITQQEFEAKKKQLLGL